MQGFPDTHFLCGKNATAADPHTRTRLLMWVLCAGPPDKKFEQVGNAVCARLAAAIGKAMLISVSPLPPHALHFVQLRF